MSVLRQLSAQNQVQMPAVSYRPSGNLPRYVKHPERYVQALHPASKSANTIVSCLNKQTEVPLGMVYNTYAIDKSLPARRKKAIKDQPETGANVIGDAMDTGNNSGDFLGFRIGDPIFKYRQPEYANRHIQKLTEFSPHAIGSFNGFEIPKGTLRLQQLVKLIGPSGANLFYSDNNTGFDVFIGGRVPCFNNGNTRINAGDLVVVRLPSVDAAVRKAEKAVEPACAEYKAGRYMGVYERFDPTDVKNFAEIAITDNIHRSDTGTVAEKRKATDLSALLPLNDGTFHALTPEEQFSLRMRHFVATVTAVALVNDASSGGKQLTYADKEAIVNRVFADDGGVLSKVFNTSMAGLLTDSALSLKYDPDMLLGKPEQTPTSTPFPGIPSQKVRTASAFKEDPSKLLREGPGRALESFAIAYNEIIALIAGVSATSSEGGRMEPFNLIKD